MYDHVWIYFSSTGWGYELKGNDIISGLDAFLYVEKTYLIEYSYSDIVDDMKFFVYEWDNSQKKRKTVFEEHKKGMILIDLLKNVDLPDYVQDQIKTTYLEEESELEKNANS